MHKLNKTLLYATLSFVGACNVSKNEMNQGPDVVPTGKCSDQQQPADRLDAVKQAKAVYYELNLIFTAAKEQQEQFDSTIKDEASPEKITSDIVAIEDTISDKFVKARMLLQKLKDLFYACRKDHSPHVEVIKGYIETAKNQLHAIDVWVFKSDLAKIALALIIDTDHQNWLKDLQNADNQINLLLEDREQLLVIKSEIRQQIKDLKDKVEADDIHIVCNKVKAQLKKTKYKINAADLATLIDQIDNLLKKVTKKDTLRAHKLSELEEKFKKAV
ncbi:MAG: hypothetical protein K2X94_00715 [Amoebophilaceae bacterium]|nr:hypothetical protein [Amoebophilaceae bacterium]